MRQQHRLKGSWLRTCRHLAVLAASAVFAAGCSSSSNTGQAGVVSQIKTNSPADIAQTSAASYDTNTSGLIGGNRLKSWLDNWAANHPAGVTGKLVILQSSGGATTVAGESCDGMGFTGREFLRSDSANNIFTYCVPTAAWVMPRLNGVMRTYSMVLDGPGIDAFLKKYNIDPRRDMIVCAMARGTTGGPMITGRCSYMLRYWGVDPTHVAILNGVPALAINDGSYFQATPTTPPNSGTISVKDLLVDSTSLQVSMEELMKIAGGSYNPPGGAFIWDARAANEYNGVAGSTAGNYGGKTAFEGHIRGAKNLAFVQLLKCASGCGEVETADPVWGSSYAYRDKATLQAIVTGLGYQPGQTVYTYCRTAFRAMITAHTAGVVLGYPTRVYDGSWSEWGFLANYQNRDGYFNLPGDSPWRAELYTDALTYNTVAQVENGEIYGPYAASANGLIEADRAYKTGALAGSGPGGGAPPNPCGG